MIDNCECHVILSMDIRIPYKGIKPQEPQLDLLQFLVWMICQHHELEMDMLFTLFAHI